MEAQLYLQDTLRERLELLRLKNSSFSLRAFAKLLDVSPASLSEFLNGKRKLSKKMIQKVAQKLCLPPKEISVLNEKIHRDSKGINHVPQSEKKAIELRNDQYYLVSDWHYYAILCLAETSDFRDDYEWIAKRLKTNISAVKEAMERLMRLGFLYYGPEGKLLCQDIEIFTSEDTPKSFLKKRHSENLSAANESLFSDDVLTRDMSFATLAINSKKLPEAKKMIRNFYDELCSFLETGEKEEVYELCIQLFPRTLVNKEKIYEEN